MSVPEMVKRIYKAKQKYGIKKIVKFNTKVKYKTGQIKSRERLLVRRPTMAKSHVLKDAAAEAVF